MLRSVRCGVHRLLARRDVLHSLAITRVLRRIGFGGIRVRYFDFLHPAIPGGLVPMVEPVLEGLERVPLLRAISGSLLIHAER